MKQFKIVAIVGKSGAGKDALLHEIMEQSSNYHEIISCTTRPPRADEINGVNYHFLTVEDFCEKINHREMLEYTTFNNWGYGTSIDALDSEKINIGVFNPEGIGALRRNENIDMITFSIISDDKTRLIRQLSREPNPDVKEIIRRYQTDEIDFEEYYGVLHGSNVFNIINDTNTNLKEITKKLIIPTIEDFFNEEEIYDS